MMKPIPLCAKLTTTVSPRYFCWKKRAKSITYTTMDFTCGSQSLLSMSLPRRVEEYNNTTGVWSKKYVWNCNYAITDREQLLYPKLARRKISTWRNHCIKKALSDFKQPLTRQKILLGSKIDWYIIKITGACNLALDIWYIFLYFIKYSTHTDLI